MRADQRGLEFATLRLLIPYSYAVKAIEGIGTDEDALSRCLGGVDKVHAMEIAAMYQSKYNKSLLDDIRGEVGGDYSTVR